MTSTGVDLLAIIEEVARLTEVGAASNGDVRALRRVLRESSDFEAPWRVYGYLLLSPTIQDMRVIRRLSSMICFSRPVPFRRDDPEWNRENIPPGLWLACVLPPLLAEENPEGEVTGPIVELLLDLTYGEEGFNMSEADPVGMDEARECLLLVERGVPDDLVCCRQILFSALAAIAEPPPPPPRAVPPPTRAADAPYYHPKPKGPPGPVISADVVLEAFLAVARLVGKLV